MVPLSHAWNELGDLLIGCRESQLVRVEGESGRVRVLYNPTPAAAPAAAAALDDVVIPAEGSTVQRATVNATPAGGQTAAAPGADTASDVANGTRNGQSNMSPTLGADEELSADIAAAPRFDVPQEPQQPKLPSGALATLVFTKNGLYNAGKVCTLTNLISMQYSIFKSPSEFVFLFNFFS